MNLIDNYLLEHTLIAILTKELGKPYVTLIKNRIVEKYGIPLSKAITHWDKVDNVLKENLTEQGAANISNQYLKSVIKLGTKSTDEKPRLVTSIEVVSKVLRVFGDDVMTDIVFHVMEEAMTREKVAEDLDHPQTTIYNKFRELINMGILVEYGEEFSPSRRRMEKYTTPFESVYIRMRGKERVLQFVPKKKLERQFLLLTKV